MPETSDLVRKSALEVVGLLDRGEVSPLELIDAVEARVEETEPHINALPTLCFGRARAHARDLMEKPVPERGPLRGLPVPIKDLTAVSGVRTTFGSLIYRDHVPAQSDALTLRLEAAGGIVYGKSATPEFGAGGHTFNDVFGVTRNPWNLERSAGGSSGGAAAALAVGSAWIAHGSDLAGSLRTPAAFCGVVGLRPTPGRIAASARDPFDTLAVQGPMARNVVDAALMLDAMCGTDPAAPLAVEAPATRFLDHALRPRLPARVAFSPNLGVSPVHEEVASCVRRAVARIAGAGVDVMEPALDLSEAGPAFHVLRGLSFATGYEDLLASHRHLMKPEVVWNIEFGLGVSAADVLGAQRTRAALYRRVAELLETAEVLICPAAIVPPFACGERYVEEVNGERFATYIDWLGIAYAVTLLSLPVIAIPCGMTGDGLPVGIQIIGRPRGEAALLSVAAALEEALAPWADRPTPLEGYRATKVAEAS